MVGKYVDLTDSYKSLNEALIHGGNRHECRVQLTFVDSEKIGRRGCRTASRAPTRSSSPWASDPAAPGNYPGGAPCPSRRCPSWASASGMQMAVIEFARHVCGLAARQLDPSRPGHATSGDRTDGHAARAHAEGRDDAPRRVSCVLEEGSLVAQALQTARRFPSATATARGEQCLSRAAREGRARALRRLADGTLVEMIELRDHPWFVAASSTRTQSRPMDCHPLFKGFIRAALQARASARGAVLGGLKV